MTTLHRGAGHAGRDFDSHVEDTGNIDDMKVQTAQKL